MIVLYSSDSHVSLLLLRLRIYPLFNEILGLKRICYLVSSDMEHNNTDDVKHRYASCTFGVQLR